MNLRNLEVGKAYKNYKELCAVLEEITKTGQARQNHIKWFGEYFRFQREGNKYVIDEIYDKEVTHREDARKDNRSIYGRYIQKLILDLLVQQMERKVRNNRKIYLSRDRLLFALGMINSNYNNCKFNKHELADFLKVNKDIVEDCYNLNDENLETALITAIKALENKALISCNIVLTVCINGEIRMATDEERELILETENKILRKMGYGTKYFVYKANAYKRFAEQVNEIVLEKAEIEYYYKSYDIIFIDKVKEEQKKLKKLLLDYEKREDTKNELNNKLVENYIKNAEDRHVKAKKKCEKALGVYKNKEIAIRNREDYTEGCIKVINTVINKNTENLIKEISNSDDDSKKKLKLRFC